MRFAINFALSYLPKIIDMIEPLTTKVFKEHAKVTGTRLNESKILTVTVFEQNNLFSSPLRLANVLESINHLYTACALMNNESPSTLSVISCDSGSDKSFDFLGLAKIIECVERIISTLWDRVIFFREHQFEERLDLINKSLPIIEHIHKLEEQKQIDPELAEILRRI
jgi:hypothetical protein